MLHADSRGQKCPGGAGHRLQHIVVLVVVDNNNFGDGRTGRQSLHGESGAAAGLEHVRHGVCIMILRLMLRLYGVKVNRNGWKK